MAESVDNIVLEQLRKLQEQNDQILEAVRYVHTQQWADRHSLRGVRVSLDGASALLVSLVSRIGRIERRLELSDDPVPTGFADR